MKLGVAVAALAVSGAEAANPAAQAKLQRLRQSKK